MSDTEQDWKPNPRRPQSTMAQAFSIALDNAFMLDSDVDHLAQSIEQKKQRMTIQARELEALQARIREAEERLKSEKVEKEVSTQDSRNDTAQGTDSTHQEGRDSDTSAATSNDMHEPENDAKNKLPAS